MYYTDKTVIFFNNDFVKIDKAKGNLYSQSLHYGNGVFEGMRSYETAEGARIFKPDEHFDRLRYGAEVMEIPFSYSNEELTAITYKLLELNNLKDAYIRPIIVVGENMGLGTPDQSDLIIQCWSWGKLMGDKLLNVKTSKYQRPNPKACYVDAKITGHYINSILARNDASKSGHDEALLLDMNNNVAECSGANIFMEKDGVLYTPPKGHIMAGITRSTIMEICKDEGIEVVEKFFDLDFLKTAESAFFTGTAAEVVGLGQLDDYKFPKPWDQTFGFKLMNLYKLEVLGKRSKSFSKAI